MTKEGILLQGLVSTWTRDIILEYQTNYPNAKILLSTWTDQNIEDITCEIIQTDAPEFTKPHFSTINHQIIGTREGLKKLDCDIILKSKSDMFVHNEKIFQLFIESCDPQKIMIPNEGFDISDQPYYVNDNCQVARKNILEDFWYKMPLYNGNYPTSNEQYLAKNYIENIKNDKDDWSVLKKNIFVRSALMKIFNANLKNSFLAMNIKK